MSTPISPPKAEDLAWGRATQATRFTTLFSLFLTLVSPLWMTANNITLEHFDGSLSATIAAFRTLGLLTFIHRYFPWPSTFGFTVYITWILFQAFLYAILLGKTCYGQLTPAGNLLQYTPNGFLAWTITHLLFLYLILSEKMSPSVLAENWEGLSVAANAYGLFLALVVYVKGRRWPSFEGDRKFSGW
jgi:7-dehydrocholesterol reductase